MSDILLKRQFTGNLPDAPEGYSRLLVNENNELVLIDQDRNETVVGEGDDLDGGGYLPPVAVSVSTSLTEVDHANRDINTTAAGAVTFTLPATATTGAKFFGTNLGAGALSVVLNGGGAVPRNALLPPTIDQFSAWEIRRHATGFVRVA